MEKSDLLLVKSLLSHGLDKHFNYCLTVVRQSTGDVLSYRSKSVGIPFEQK